MTKNSDEVKINEEIKKSVSPENKPPDYDPSWLKGTSAEKAIRQLNANNTAPPKKDFSDPIFKKISRINGKVNSMNMSELKKALSELQLNIQ